MSLTKRLADPPKMTRRTNPLDYLYSFVLIVANLMMLFKKI